MQTGEWGRGSPKPPQGARQTSPWPPEGSKCIRKGGQPRPGSQRQSAQEPAQTLRCPWSVSEIPDVVTADGLARGAGAQGFARSPPAPAPRERAP